MEIFKAFDEHEKWLKNNKEGKQLDLSGSSLFGRDLKGRDLSNANLSNCDMTQCDLTGCRMVHCNLAGTTLTGAKMAKVDLTGANMTDATCRAANLQMANLENAILRSTDFFAADLRKCKLDGTDIRNANFSKAIMDSPVIARVQEEPEAHTEGPSMRPETEVTGRGATAGLPGNPGRDANLDATRMPGASKRRGGNRGSRRGEEADTIVRRGESTVDIKPAPEKGGVVTKPKSKASKGKKKR